MAADSYKLSDLVFVSDDTNREHYRGCDAISVVDVRTGSALAHGQWQVSPEQLAISSDGSVATSMGQDSALHVLARLPAPSSGWFSHFQEDERRPREWAAGAAIAIPPDDTAVLIAANGAVESYSINGLLNPSRGPRLARFMFSEESTTAADIEVSADSRTAYLVGTDGLVHIVDVIGMSQQREPIPYVPTSWNKAYRTKRTYATLSPNGRYLVINTADQDRGSLNVIDLSDGSSGAVRAPGSSESWGVQFNYADLNHGLLAVHARTKVAVYRLEPPAAPILLASERVPPPSLTDWIGAGGREMNLKARIAAIAWSGEGGAVIANLGLPSRSEWRILDFALDPSPSLTHRLDFESCEWNGDPPRGSYYSIPQGLDVVTLNRHLHSPKPSPTPTMVPTPTHTPTDIPTPTATIAPPTTTPSPIHTATTTPTHSPTPTRAPQAVFLPLVLFEECYPPQRRVDVALVIDASTSMQLRTSQNRMKIAAAIEAARAFLGELSLPHDQASVISFYSDASVLQELTGKRSDLNAALNRIQVARQTRIDLGIEVAHEELTSTRHKPENQPVMIVLTDGKANPVPVSAAVEKARLAKADGITIFTIGLGDDLDFEALEAMASKRSYYYHAPDGEDLQDIYAQIAVAIPCPAEHFWGKR